MNMLKTTILILSALACACPTRAQQLDAAQMAAARTKAQVCFACHGPDGNSTVGEYPILAGQSWRYIYIELKDFKAGHRSDEQMSPVAEKLSTEDMMLLGEFFAAQKQAPIKSDVPSRRVRRPERDPPRCGAVAAVHQEAACRLQGAQAHQRRGQYDERRIDPVRRGHREPIAIHREPYYWVSPGGGESARPLGGRMSAAATPTPRITLLSWSARSILFSPSQLDPPAIIPTTAPNP
jgi:cytochrome c553